MADPVRLTRLRDLLWPRQNSPTRASLELNEKSSSSGIHHLIAMKSHNVLESNVVYQLHDEDKLSNVLFAEYLPSFVSKVGKLM